MTKRKIMSRALWRALALLLALLLALSAVACGSADKENGDKGTPGPDMGGIVVASSENYEVTLDMMTYALYAEYHELVNTYQQLSQQVGFSLVIPCGKGGEHLDTSKPLDEQYYSIETLEGEVVSVTWLEHFLSRAQQTVGEVLSICEWARVHGIELSAKDLAQIDEIFAGMRSHAEMYGVDLATYISAMYGEGVEQSDMRAMMELMLLATVAGDGKRQELLDGVTDADVESHYEQNRDTYDRYVDYIAYTFEVTYAPSTNEDEAVREQENAQKRAQYEAKQALYAAYVEELAACTTEQAFVTRLRAIWQECGIDEQIANVTFENVRLSDNNDKALFKEKDGKYQTGTAGYQSKAVEAGTYKTVTSSYRVGFITVGSHRNLSPVRSVGHILFMTNTYQNVSDVSKLSDDARVLAQRVLDRGANISAEEMAKELLTLMREEGKLTQKTVDGKTFWAISDADFEQYGSRYTEDGNVFYPDVLPGQMVSEFNDWLFDGGRVEGEISYPGGVGTTFGYHVMLYCGNESVAFVKEIREVLGGQRYEAWLAASKTEFPATVTESGEYIAFLK